MKELCRILSRDVSSHSSICQSTKSSISYRQTMKLTTFALQLLTVSAFTSPSVVTRHALPLFMSTTVENVAPITVTGNNIDLTPALVEYINKKLERPLGKLRAHGSIKDCSVHLIVNKNPKVRGFRRRRSLKVYHQPTLPKIAAQGSHCHEESQVKRYQCLS